MHFDVSKDPLRTGNKDNSAYRLPANMDELRMECIGLAPALRDQRSLGKATPRAWHDHTGQWQPRTETDASTVHRDSRRSSDQEWFSARVRLELAPSKPGRDETRLTKGGDHIGRTRGGHDEGNQEGGEEKSVCRSPRTDGPFAHAAEPGLFYNRGVKERQMGGQPLRQP
ncbi:hypothetical protein MRX96_033598 [Rhipicephalus microplus]